MMHIAIELETASRTALLLMVLVLLTWAGQGRVGCWSARTVAQTGTAEQVLAVCVEVAPGPPAMKWSCPTLDVC